MEGSDDISPPPIIHSLTLPMNLFHTIMMNQPTDPDNSTDPLEGNITNQSFNEQSKYTRVTTKDFINSLPVQKVNADTIDKKITCALCLDELQEGEDVIEEEEERMLQEVLYNSLNNT